MNNDKKFLYLLTIFFLSCSFAFAQKGTINFKVKNAITGIAENATINVVDKGGKKIFSAQNNFKQVSFSLPIGEYIVNVISKGFTTQNTHYLIEENKILNVIVSLDPIQFPVQETMENKVIISGYITDDQTFLPIKNATIKLQKLNISSTTSDNGYFEIVSNTFTPKNAVVEAIVKENIIVERQGYTSLIYKNIPLFEGGFQLQLQLKQGSENKTITYQHKLIDGDDKETEDSFTKNQSTEISVPIANLFQQNFKTTACSTTIPNTLRLFHGDNNGACTSCTGCTTIEQMSLEQYVRTGLDDEWISSWADHSLMAGAVAYRTYGAYHVAHPYGTNYDIVAYPCRQHWNGATTYTNTTNAANATVGEVLVNSSNLIVFSEYAAETNNFGCGDCNSGQGAWPCISDAACCGATAAGHGRGMCQWGSHRWSQQGQTYRWVLDHYYNLGGYTRCATGVLAPEAFTLTATPECNGTTSQIRLNWTTSNFATTYDLFRNGTLYSSNIIGTQFINTAITVGNTYTYYVRANNATNSINNANGNVSATALNCSATSVVTVNNNPFQLKIYPNPNNGKFLLEAKLVTNKVISVQILNSIGQVIQEFDEKIVNNNYQKQINITNINSSLFFIKVMIDKKIYVLSGSKM